MDRKYAAFLIIAAFFLPVSAADESLSSEQILKRIVAKSKQNEEQAKDIGFHQLTTIKKMRDGKVFREDIRLHRITWIENKPYLELLKVNGQEPDTKEKKEELERKAKFIKSLRKKPKNDPDDVTWEEMYAKYDFQPIDVDPSARYVFSFRPKAGKLTEHSKEEKIFNHIAGKLWADENFNIVRAEAALVESVRFGLGILGKIEELEIKFEQQDFDQIQVPSYINVHFKVRIALLKTEERVIEATYMDFFRRSDGGGADD